MEPRECRECGDENCGVVCQLCHSDYCPDCWMKYVNNVFEHIGICDHCYWENFGENMECSGDDSMFSITWRKPRDYVKHVVKIHTVDSFVAFLEIFTGIVEDIQMDHV